MQSIAVFLHVAKSFDFQRNDADVSRTQEVCHMTNIVFGPPATFTALALNLNLVIGTVFPLMDFLFA